MVIKNQKSKIKNQKYKSKLKNPEVRYLNDMKMVLYDQEWAKTVPNFPVYYMYRGIKRKNNLRYDITVIPPKMLGQEFPKTKGHEHSNKYGEVYIVLKGEAIYLIQKWKKNKIKDVYAVKAKKGNIVIIPPYYGHVTINPAKKDLKEANWISKKCKNIYDLFEKKQGACYYYTKKGWIRNKNYKKIPKLRFEKPSKKIPKNLNFLK
jgi:glucose-6-phosphate isomerase